MKNNTKPFSAVSRNPCKLCPPLGAALACKGIANTITLLHGSQGCATYIRRYLISHFKEPVDIASSSFSEQSVVFGGKELFFRAVDNIRQQYAPDVIAVATTCLSETIGDDVPAFIRQYHSLQNGSQHPHIIHISTPGYAGTHTDGFRDALRAIAESFAAHTGREHRLNIFSGMVSPKDIRYLKEILDDCELAYTLLPDYSETLDGGLWSDYERIPRGGSTVAELGAMGNALASIELGAACSTTPGAGSVLYEKFAIPHKCLALPVGITLTDQFMECIASLACVEIPDKYRAERERLIDAYADAHKILAGLRAAVFGDEETVTAVSAFLAEIGVTPLICLSGCTGDTLHMAIPAVAGIQAGHTVIYDDADFMTLKNAISQSPVDFMIGNSKGYTIARELDIPLIRTGFPVHDRAGAARMQMLGYRGTQELFDRIVNAILEYRQSKSPVGYTYW